MQPKLQAKVVTDIDIPRNMLQTQDLRVDQEKEPCIGFTQENSIENSVQDSLPLYTKASWSMLTTSSLP